MYLCFYKKIFYKRRETLYEIKEFYGQETLRFKEICCELFRYADEGFENREEYEKKLIERIIREKRAL